MNRRALVAAGVGLFDTMKMQRFTGATTPVGAPDEPWLTGSSARMNMPDDAVAEPGTVQVVRVSPVLFAEFAAILIHNASDRAVMLETARGDLRASGIASQSPLAAYGIPPAILPPGEYWIGRLMTPAELEVGTTLQFDADVQLQTASPRQASVTTLLSALVPDEEFAMPASGEPWPIRYENRTSLPTSRLVGYQHVFFDDDGEICGFLSADDRSNSEGEAVFPMKLTNTPGASTGGAVLGEVTDRWLGQWSHAPNWDAFADFEFGT